ncbi:DUF3703 domain-containing protein [Ramlibacter sp. WS9]|uniref:DUF3703 domain-containing protein n=1 Tax=Ramlibacter sp. WS9 TaxID=1882741 RepID=UPI001142D0B5|nr:DUF3703 domain-containing protein [Ramlibacter sp. WS9]ROZ78251.1 DUF3703 domain-containing protein [Ramlibacter sp. WS9]
MHIDREQQRRVYARLVDGFRAGATEGVEQRWQWLMAAHIIGQMDFRLHVHSHVVMLAFAAKTGDWPEVGGQLIRLALVPLGHLVGRLPTGNIGRATVNAFQPMPLSMELQQLIGEARLAAVAKPARNSAETSS